MLDLFDGIDAFAWLLWLSTYVLSCRLTVLVRWRWRTLIHPGALASVLACTVLLALAVPLLYLPTHILTLTLAVVGSVVGVCWGLLGEQSTPDRLGDALVLALAIAPLALVYWQDRAAIAVQIALLVAVATVPAVRALARCEPALLPLPWLVPALLAAIPVAWAWQIMVSLIVSLGVGWLERSLGQHRSIALATTVSAALTIALAASTLSSA